MKKPFTLIIFCLLAVSVSMLYAGHITFPVKPKFQTHSKAHSSPLIKRLKSVTSEMKTFSHPRNENPQINSNLFRPGREAIYYWDDNASSWYFSDSTRYTYNSAGNATLAIQYDASGNLYYRTTNTYNGNGKLTQTVTESWNGLSWDNAFRETYTYNGSGQMTQDMTEYYTTSWFYLNNYLYTYGPYGQTQELDQTWNGTAWVDNYKYTYTYNGSGQIITEIDQNWNGSSWDNTKKADYSYNVSSQIKGVLFQDWNSGWEKSDSVNIVWYQWAGFFSADSKLSLWTVQNWTGSTWQNSFKETYTYDTWGNQIDDVSEDWVLNAWKKTDEIKNPLTYDGNNNITQKIEQDWDTTLSTLVNYQRWDYGDYLLFTGVNDLNKETGLLVYPNPSDGVIHISLEDLNINNGHLSIFNSISEEVYAEEINSGNSFYKKITLNAASGIYFVKFIDGDKEYQQKIVFK